ncbi:MAG TPA: O-antigen ligase family protein [Magnetospirillum sp.]|nr:O-antigen ligase family protein [Magnetospirillum sp.]
MDKHLTPLPRPAARAFAVLAAAAFALSMMVPALNPEQQSLLGVPLAVIALIWAIPLMLALMRGDSWAFIVALALLMFLTDSNFRARAWNDKSVDAQVLVKGLVWLGCGMVGVIRVSARGWLLGRPPVIFAGALVVLMALSAMWSPTPLYTIQSAVAYGWMLLFGLAAATVLDERQVLQAVALGAGLIVLPSLAIAPFAMGLTPPSPGSTGEPDRLRGLTDHPIPLAEVSALFTFAVAALALRARGWGRLGLWLLMAAGIATAAMTQSRIPPLAMVASVFAFLAYRRGGWLLMVPTLTVTIGGVLLLEAMGGFAAMLPPDLLSLISRSGHSVEILSLSGRLDIWPYVLDRIAEAPLLGHGAASGMMLFKGFVRWKITHAHNLYLQSLLYLGVVGFALLMGVLLCQMRVFLRAPSPVRDILVLYIVLKGLTEQSILSNMPSGTVAVWMVTVGMAALAWRRPVSAAGIRAGTAPASPASTTPSRGYAAR